MHRGITPTSRSEGAMNRENNESNERTRAKCLTRRARRQPRSRSLLFGGRVICLPRIIDESGRNARAFARAEAERKKRKRGATRYGTKVDARRSEMRSYGHGCTVMWVWPLSPDSRLGVNESGRLSRRTPQLCNRCVIALK